MNKRDTPARMLCEKNKFVEMLGVQACEQNNRKTIETVVLAVRLGQEYLKIGSLASN